MSTSRRREEQTYLETLVDHDAEWSDWATAEGRTSKGCTVEGWRSKSSHRSASQGRSKPSHRGASQGRSKPSHRGPAQRSKPTNRSAAQRTSKRPDRAAPGRKLRRLRAPKNASAEVESVWCRCAHMPWPSGQGYLKSWSIYTRHGTKLWGVHLAVLGTLQAVALERSVIHKQTVIHGPDDSGNREPRSILK